MIVLCRKMEKLQVSDENLKILIKQFHAKNYFTTSFKTVWHKSILLHSLSPFLSFFVSDLLSFFRLVLRPCFHRLCPLQQEGNWRDILSVESSVWQDSRFTWVSLAIVGTLCQKYTGLARQQNALRFDLGWCTIVTVISKCVEITISWACRGCLVSQWKGRGGYLCWKGAHSVCSDPLDGNISVWV